MKDEKTYITLEALATMLGLPKKFLKTMAIKGDIPSLNVFGRMRFNPIAVQTALESLATKANGAANT